MNILRNLKKVFSNEKLYTETEARKLIAFTVHKVADEIKAFNAGAVDKPLDKCVDDAVEKFLKDGPTGGW